MNEAQLSAIIAAAVAEAVKQTQDALAPLLTQLEDKNKHLLSDLKKAQGKPEPADKKETIADALARIDAETDRLIAETEATDYSALYKAAKPAPQPKPQTIGTTPNGDFVLDREAARNPSVYRAARAAAEKAGKPLRIVAANESAPHAANGKTDFVVGRDRFVHASVIQGQLQQLHAETTRAGKRLVAFKHPDQLPDAALAVYNAPVEK